MEQMFLAIFIDLNNSPSKIKLERLMNVLILSEQSNYNFIFAVKSAYGVLHSVSPEFRTELRDYNFSILETPRIGLKKNRADLFISIDAFETLYVNNPGIDRYIFVTSDSDFTVVMDKLRKYGKEVWLVCRTADETKQLDRSFDVRHTSYKRFIDLVRSFQKQEIITLEESESGLVRITDINLSKIEEGNSGSNLTNHL